MIRRWYRAARSAYDRLVVEYPRCAFAFCVGFLGGLANNFVDIDHIAMAWGHPHGRIAHPSFLIVASIVALYCFARLGGLFIRMVLKKIRRQA